MKIMRMGQLCMHEDIQIELTDEEIDQLIHIYVQHQLSPESLSVYNELMQQGSDISAALKSAIVNESVIIALKKVIEMGEGE